MRPAAVRHLRRRGSIFRKTPCHRQRCRAPCGITMSDSGLVRSIAFLPFCHHSNSRSPPICRWRHRFGCSCSGISPRTDDMLLKNDIVPRRFPGRNLITRSFNQRHQLRVADHGDACGWMLRSWPSHRAPECVFSRICISSQSSGRSNG